MKQRIAGTIYETDVEWTDDMRAQSEDRTRGHNPSSWIRAEKRLAIYMRDRFRCLYCDVDLIDAWSRRGEKGGTMITLDHIIPRSGGGGNDEQNLVTCCINCNASRGNMSWLAFIRDRVRDEAEIQGWWGQATVDYGVAVIRKRVQAARRRKLNLTFAKAILRDRVRSDVKEAEAAR